MLNNKKGMTTMMLIAYIFIGFFVIIFLAVMIYLASNVDNAFRSLTISVGNVSFNNTYNQTMAPALNKLINQSDNLGISLLLGMIIVMLICGYKFRNKRRLFIILDILIIIVCFIISVFIQNSYNTIIRANDDLYSIFTNELANSSTFLLRLPLIISIVGVLIMVVTYATINKKRSPVIYGDEYVEQ